jgi:DNA-binding NarL/FixJ family response regulator
MQKVFVVEDSQLVCERLMQMLAHIPGAAVVGQAADVEEAIGGILTARPDLVLLDLCLEHGSGFDVLRAVRRAEPAIDFYMLSNFSSEPYRRHAERLGARGFFDKSKDFERVRDLVAQRASIH